MLPENTHNEYLWLSLFINIWSSWINVVFWKAGEVLEYSKKHLVWNIPQESRPIGNRR